MESKDSIEKLCSVYKSNSQIGLVLGAGVSKDSGVPLYKELALLLFEATQSELKDKSAPNDAMSYLNTQLQLFKDGKETVVEPDKIIQFICNYIGSDQAFKRFMKNVIFHNCPRDENGNLELTHKRIYHKTYKQNATLDALITFCATIPFSKTKNARISRWETNPKVGAILTTNYDNLVEGSFGSKYGK